MTWGVPKPLERTFAIACELTTWWWSELRDIGNQLLRFLPSRQSPQVFIRVSRDSLTVERREANAWNVVGTVPVRSDGDWPAELPGLPPELAGARAAIMIPEAELFFCDFELPSATERQLTSVLRLQLERVLPVSLEQVLFDRQVVAREGARFTVRVGVAHRARIEKLRDVVAQWQLAPVCAGVVSNQGAVEFNFLKRRRDPLRWQPSSQDMWLMRAAAAGVALLALVIGVQWMRERSIVNAESAELRAQAMRLAGERARVVNEARPLVALQSIAGTRDAPAVLSALSASMPHSAWFSHIEIIAHVDEPGRLRMTGAVASRDEALAAIRALPGVRNLQATSAFNGEVGGPEFVEFIADFDAALVPAKAAAL